MVGKRLVHDCQSLPFVMLSTNCCRSRRLTGTQIISLALAEICTAALPAARRVGLPEIRRIEQTGH